MPSLMKMYSVFDVYYIFMIYFEKQQNKTRHILNKGFYYYYLFMLVVKTITLE